MKVIQPNCRAQFTAEDIEFVIEMLGQPGGSGDGLARLLVDMETRDQILDHERLYQALLEQRGCLKVSNHFYFYVLVRHGLRKAGIEERSVADYVAEVLTEFSREESTRCIIAGQLTPLEYYFEMLGALQKADDRTGFYIRTHMGNHSLFFTGLFPDRIRSRAEVRGFPDLKYYEHLGRSSFRVASDHRLAGQYDLGPIFSILSEHFEPTRRALNDLSERIFCLNEVDYAFDGVLYRN